MLDDQAWQQAVRIDRFVQETPRDGEPATDSTEAWIGYDSRHLYFAFHVRYSDPSLMRANFSDRDQAGEDDTVSVYLDPFLDQQRAYQFSVNGRGVQGDAILTGADGDDDDSWDALFESKGRLVDDGWIVELAIPFKSLRYPAAPDNGEHRWGLQLQRTIQAKDERDVWAPISRDIDSFLNQMGVLCGLRGLSTTRNLEILPTLTAVQLGSRDEGRRYVEAPVDPTAGLNVKYGLSSDMTLDFTVNPDFSQIEADNPRITLNQRFPIFYEEKRPFFLEGQEIFATEAGGDTSILHTRTIVDPFLGLKLTGQIAKMTIGVIAANDQAPGRRDDPNDPAAGHTAKVAVGRARYDLYTESFLGAIVTDREFLQSSSRLFGVDGRFRLNDTQGLSFMYSRTDHTDEAGERSRGSALDLDFERSGRHLGYGLQHTNRTPGFQTDLGFVRRTDIAATEADVSYQFWPEGAIIRWGPSVTYLRNYDHDGILQDESFDAEIDVQFARNISLQMERRQGMERFEGIEFFTTTHAISADLNYSRRFSAEIEVDWGDGIEFDETPVVGRALEGSLELTLRPTSRLESSIAVDLSRLKEAGTGDMLVNQRIFRAVNTYQFSDRLSLRNILEYDTGFPRLGTNLLLTYRINSGTVAFIGYDDRFERFEDIDRLPRVRRFERATRSVFVKLSYLFRL